LSSCRSRSYEEKDCLLHSKSTWCLEGKEKEKRGEAAQNTHRISSWKKKNLRGQKAVFGNWEVKETFRGKLVVGHSARDLENQ